MPSPVSLDLVGEQDNLSGRIGVGAAEVDEMLLGLRDVNQSTNQESWRQRPHRLLFVVFQRVGAVDPPTDAIVRTRRPLSRAAAL